MPAAKGGKDERKAVDCIGAVAVRGRSDLLLFHPILDQLTRLELAGMAQAFAELEAYGL
jgi:hypothetical protein